MGRILRLGFVLIAGALTAFFVAQAIPGVVAGLSRQLGGQFEDANLGFAIAAGAVMGFLVGAAVSNIALRLTLRAYDRWEHLEQGDRVTIFLGLFGGLLVSVPFLVILFSIVPDPWRIPLMIVFVIGVPGLTLYMLHSMQEILPWNRGRARGKRRGIKILDTNVIIDGRIAEVARTGFLEGQLYVPGFVLEELQYIADSSDPLRRQRGRRGLEVLRHLQTDFQLEVRAHDRLAPDSGDGVDARLVRLARAMGADIVTNDFNLNRVAVLQDVKVLNINDLALGLRPNVLPQESLHLMIIREGNQPGQGVGYLEDGTMVVVENGRSHIGEQVDITVTQVIQTERGKMIFGEIPEGGGEGALRQKRPSGRK
jgi:uncharacterized protein YacL